MFKAIQLLGVFSKKNIKQFFSYVTEFFNEWNNHQCTLQAAAIAFYSAFSLAPSLVLIVAVASFFYGAEAAQGQLIGQAREIIGSDAAASLQAMIANAWRTKMGTGATIMSLFGIMVGASATFASLNAALNRIWPSPSNSTWSNIAALVRVRLMSFGLVIGSGFLIVVLLLLDATLNIIGNWPTQEKTTSLFLVNSIQKVFSFSLSAAVFSTLLKLLPDAPLNWRSAFIGGTMAALLFSIGKNLFSIYLSQAGTANTFGAAGSLAVILMWLYFSACVFLAGAELAAMHAKRQFVKL